MGLVGMIFLAFNVLLASPVKAFSNFFSDQALHKRLHQTPQFPSDEFHSYARRNYDFHHMNSVKRGPPESNTTNKIPFQITNMCPETIWPAIFSAEGTGPGTGGFKLESGNTVDLYVGSTWKGRVWGRTNCSFNDEGTGSASSNGGRACLTGDCGAVLDCSSSGEVPATLAEFTLAGGETGMQTFYDISLVDGYNLPIGLRYIPSKNTSDIPPNLTNAACIATPGYLADTSRIGTPDNTTGATNSSYVLPLESIVTNEDVERWCPWDYQVYKPQKPGNGVYPYPDDNINRPVFDPCYSACAYTRSPEDCCTDDYNDPNVCKPGMYSKAAKSVCPDAYSFAYDDKRSTFILPKGGGWEVIFCPKGRSTDILSRLGSELETVAYSEEVDSSVINKVSDIGYVYGVSGSPGYAAGASTSAAFVILITTIVAGISQVCL